MHDTLCLSLAWLVFLSLFGTVSCRRLETPPSVQSRPQPFVESKSAWSAATLAELNALLRRGSYEELERRLDAAQAAYERDPLREFEPAAGFSTFYSSDPANEAPLRDWTQARPDAAAAHLARGLHLARKGWLQRGYRFAHRMPPEQFERMQEQFDAAQAELERALALNPRLTLADVELVSIAMAEGDDEEAKARLEHALSLNPLSYTIRRAYMASLEPKWGGSVEQMAAFAEEAQPHAARNPRLVLLKGFVAAHVDAPRAVREKDQPRALRHYDEGLSYGEDAAFLRGRAQTLAALGRHREAIDHCTRVLEIWPHNLMALRLRAEYWHALGQTQEAFADIALGLSFDATDEDLLALRAWAQDQAGKHEKSLADFDSALQVRPNSPALWANKGLLLVERLGQMEEGRRACQKALELDKAEANGWLCLGLIQARQGSAESRASFESFLRLSRGPGAYTQLAYRYRDGNGVAKDPREAARLFEEAAERGDVLAQTNVGFHYLNGDGVVKDFAKAARWIQAAAKAGDATGMCYLGKLYEEGWGVPRDLALAADWYRKSMAGGYLHARFNLGVLYWHGRGVTQDLVEAYRLLKGAADRGDVDAQKRLPALRGQMSGPQVEDGEKQLAAESAVTPNRR